eukprot:CAMPEP_0176375436 /NCGR_PEP_ID=MMETSP0126-20121128/27508_1 /TAXON_ID=141414 ORGANISM="Strombidinopsis acuminatum, Strain SPMC142" /NCGR_SAMPLE_ID=MMETSP0126 /ASSEMBLY_ACC=CAM_ASM_000229 /LENGTH=84 /DNA_ID=CAMNT_0017736515 /DNA_START=582 /DNA_END=836 /DNA_ORIENTATION=+
MTKGNAYMESELEGFTKKLSDVEVNTLWKIKDYEQLLHQRPTEKFLVTSLEQLREQVLKESSELVAEGLKKAGPSARCMLVQET